MDSDRIVIPSRSCLFTMSTKYMTLRLKLLPYKLCAWLSPFSKTSRRDASQQCPRFEDLKGRVGDGPSHLRSVIPANFPGIRTNFPREPLVEGKWRLVNHLATPVNHTLVLNRHLEPTGVRTD
jgi:hypothetical protein